MDPEPVREFIISGHARFEMERRKISDEIVRQVLDAPEQRSETRKGRIVLHSRVLLGAPATMYLVNTDWPAASTGRSHHTALADHEPSSRSARTQGDPFS